MAGSLIFADANGVDANRIDFSAALKAPDLTNAEDRAFIESGGLPRDQLLRFLTDLQYEPSWRRQADVDVDYYDGHQLTPQLKELMAQRGLPDLVINLIQPTINNVLGLEAKTRADAEVTFDDDESEEVALALNQKMSDAHREARIDYACSEAYAGMVKSGLGWVEVSDNNNPMQYRYRVRPTHRREIWWDWRDTDPGLENSRYLVRKAWYDDDVVEMLLPGYRQMVGGGWNAITDGFLAVVDNIGAGSTGLDGAGDYARGISLEAAEWRDTQRKRSLICEVWYRVWQRGYVVRLPNDRVVECDPQNPQHMAAVAAGAVMPMPAFWPKMRQSVWIGPRRILDQWSPLPHQRFPYVPFWGFREDLNSMPYGAIRAMRSPQDEINNRRARMAALLSARRVIVDADALSETHNGHAQVAAQASSHNHYIVTNPNRTNKDAAAFRIDTNSDLSVAQLEILRESKMEINAVSGVFTTQQGETHSGQSGYAINSLVEQGSTTLAELGDNHKFSRLRVYENLLEHIKRDSTQEHEVRVGEGKQRKIIILNQRGPDGGVVFNNVKMSTARVVLQDVPASAGYRQQQFIILAEMVKGLPPEISQFLIDFVIEASDIPQRKKIANRLRQALHLPSPGDDQQQPQIPPELQAQIQQGQQTLQQQGLLIQDLQQELAKAVNTIKTGDAQHKNRLDELAQEKELAAIKHGHAMAQAAGPEVMAIKPLLDQFEQDTGARIDALAGLIQSLAAQMQPAAPAAPVAPTAPMPPLAQPQGAM